MAPRRSARLQAAYANEGRLAPLQDPEKRITKPKPKVPPNQRKPAKLDCATCGRNLGRHYFPKAVTRKCAHNVTTCKACTKAWISTQLDTVTYDNISCPECPELLDNASVKANATRAAYDRFNELERRGIADSTPGWRWCLAPRCNAGQVHQPSLHTKLKLAGTGKKHKRTRATDNDTICTCTECGAKACVPCDRPFHEDETCVQFQQRIKKAEHDEIASLKTIAEECKKCPFCTRNIERRGGCDQMTCIKCGTRFCWLCMLTYATINKSGHGPNCIYSEPGRIDPHAAHPQNNGNGNGGNQGFGAWVAGGLHQFFHG